MRRTAGASIVSSPVLVGAVTILVITVAVFLAYNANKGLPFVPTYDVYATVPSGANLVPGNEVRVGGFRVGVIENIRPATIEEDGRARSVALLDLKLDKLIEPLAVDTAAIVRTRSALGLKYLELEPGSSQETIASGDTLPIENSGRIVEFDDFLNTFDDATRENSRRGLTGLGNAVASRGESINAASAPLPRFFGSLKRVMAALNDESTGLDELFRQIGRASAQVAPVADVQAALFTNMADTFEALARDPEALRQTIVQSPPTLDTATASFIRQRPFLVDLAELSARLRPAAQQLPRSLPAVNSALSVGRRVLPRTADLNRRLQGVFRSLDGLARQPDTARALDDLRYALTVLAPTVRFVAPYQTVCNYGTHFFNPLGEHIAEPVDGGTVERIELSFDNTQQQNHLGSTENSRFADTDGRNADPYQEASPGPFSRVNSIFNAPAIDDRGRADCIGGQWGYVRGPLVDTGRYGRRDLGGHAVVFNDSFPVSPVGSTFTGVPSLKKIDRGTPNSIRRAPYQR